MILYVAPYGVGSDDNSGSTYESPLLHISKALSMLPRNELNTVLVRRSSDPGVGGVFDEEQAWFVDGGFGAAHSSVSVLAMESFVARAAATGAQCAPIADWTSRSDGKTRLYFVDSAWTPDAHLGWFGRIARDGRELIFDLPCARNGVEWVDLDVGRMQVGGESLAEMLAEGDVFSFVQPPIEVRNQLPDDNFNSLVVNGKGAGFWRSAGPPTFQGISFPAFFAANAWNLSFSQCEFRHIDNNFMGGSACFANCTSKGMQFQGGFCVQHDQAGCWPVGEGPIKASLNDPSMELLVVGSMVVGRGGGNSALGASYLAEKNVSIYDATGSRAGINVFRGSFVANPPGAAHSRNVFVQGDGNGVGIRCSLDGYARINDFGGQIQGNQSSTPPSDLVLEGHNPESWSSFVGSHSGEISNLNGRITTQVPS